jgi:hypothetical protein
MRQPTSVLRYLVILLALSFAARAHADDRSEARTHYQAGVKYYSAGDYRSAIREFSAAQQLTPADLNNYNLALCYDKLGDAEPATQYYRAFLDKQPNTDKRAEIEASISRLEAASRSAASKKAEEVRKAEEARKAAEAARRPEGPTLGPAPGPTSGTTAGPVIGPSAGPAVGPAPGPAVGPVLGPAAGPPVGPAAGPAVAPPAGPVLGPAPAPAPVVVGAVGATAERKPRRGPAVSGSIGTPSTATPVSTGDAQLDRINAINIDQVRDQRVGGAASGLTDTRGGPAVAAGAGAAQPGQPAPPAPSGANGQPLPGSPDQPKETPVYKKWWFWAVVAVSGYVVYELATSSSTSSQPIRGRELPPTGRAAAQPGGLTLLSW